MTRPAAGGTLDRIIASEGGGAPTSDHASDISSTADSDVFNAEERKKFATVVRPHEGGSTEYKFPIPPKGHPGAEEHARNALARLDQSDLTDEEKEAVRRKAHSVLESAESTKETAVPPTETKEVETSEDETTPTPTPPKETAPAAPVAATSLKEGETETTIPPVSAKQITEEFARIQRERDAAAAELQEVRHILDPGPGPAPPDPSVTAVQLLEQIKRERDMEHCSNFLEAQLHESKLPDPIQARMRRRYEGKVFETARLVEDINDEREVLGKLSSSGLVRDNGGEKVVLGLTAYEQLQAAFDDLFDIKESEAPIHRLGGIRDAFRVATGVDITSIAGVDRPLQEAYAEGLRNYVTAKLNSGELTEAEGILREANEVTTSTFSFLLGTSMNKRLLKDYQAWPSEWQKFCSVVALKDFKLQDRVRLGAFGSLATVAEDGPYTNLTLADTHATYTPTKRGNLVVISRETIINDDLYAIKQIPQKLAVSAAFTLAEFVYQLLDPAAGNIFDAHKLFDPVNHFNSSVATADLGTANKGVALSSAAMQTGTIAMRKQLNAGNKPIGLKPRYLLVAPDLEFTAMTILKSAGLPGGSNNDINPMMGYCEPIVAPQLNAFTNLLATTSFAALVADPRVVDTIEIGFIGGQVNPVLFIQDQPLYGANFSNDAISYKVRHEYGGAVVDFRGFYLINN